MKRMLLIALVATIPVAALRSAYAGGDPLPWQPREGWRTDAAWYDGQAEKAVYQATRSIYGVPRRYLATAYTNKQFMDEATTTKATGSGAERTVEVFKHHWSERVGTENYDYDFSTATFLRTEDLAPFKLTASTQEDCGASFKQIHREDGRLHWFESVYFPGDGIDEGKLPEGSVHFCDSLSLLLRDHPFTEGAAVRLELVPSQRSTRSVSFEPQTRMVSFVGTEQLNLPAGSVSAHHLVLADVSGRELAHYWFAAEAAAPWMHVMVQYEEPGLSMKLQSLERTAYWERG